MWTCHITGGSGIWGWEKSEEYMNPNGVRGFYPVQAALSVVVPLVCPGGAQLSGSSCSCVSGYVEDSSHTSCVPFVDPNTALCKSLAGQSTYLTSPGSAMPGATVCGAIGCNVTWSDFVMRVTDRATGKTTSQGDATITATPCTPTPDTAAAATTCKGTIGMVNGLEVCVDVDPNTNIVESTKKTSSDTQTTSPTGSDTASVSSSSVTTCAGAGSCTTVTTTTTTTPTGTTTKTESKTEPLTDFCATNPTALQCKNSSFSGSCGSPPVCSGDAVTCAIAAATFATNCALNPPDDGMAAKLAAIVQPPGTTPGAVIGTLPGNLSVTFGPNNFDQTNMLTGSCIQDRSITVMGQVIQIPLSGVCSYLVILGQIMVTVSLLGAAVIVFRG